MATKTIYEENTIQFGDTGVTGLYLGMFDTVVPLAEGQEYILVWNGTEYECTAKVASFNGTNGIGIGNFALAGLGVYTGEPFLLGTATDGSFTACYSTATGANTIAICFPEPESTNETLFFAQTVASEFFNVEETYIVSYLATVQLEEGKKYRVLFDKEQVYEGIAKVEIDENGVSSYLGNAGIFGTGEDTGEHFLLTTALENTDAGMIGQTLLLIENFSATTHTVEVYLVNGEVETVTDTLVLLDNQGIEQHLTGVKGLKVLTTGGAEQTFIAGEAVEKTVNLDFSSGDMEVIPEDGTLYKKVTVPQPLTLVPENIAKDVNVAGVIGTLSGGSGGEHSKSKPIRFFDVYGDVICSFTRAEIRKMTELPEAPAISGLTFDKWNYTLEELQSELYFADVGAFYKKGSDPATVIVVHTMTANQVVTLGYNFYRSSSSGAGAIYFDWGDGNTDQNGTTLSSMSNGTAGLTMEHTYSTPGTYVVVITSNNSTCFLGCNYGSYIDCSVNGKTWSAGLTQCPAVVGDYTIRSISARLKIDNIGFCNALKFVCGEYDFPSYSTNVGMVVGCGALQALSIHGEVPLIPGLSPEKYRNKSLLNYLLWSGTTISRITTSATNFITGNIGNPNLKEVYVDITGSIIKPTMMNVEVSLLFNKTTPPTINTTPEWGTKPIYVPDEAIELYKAADKWATVADYIYPASAYPDY